MRLTSLRAQALMRLALLGCALISHPSQAADGGALFEERCAACHGIGEAPKIGPDLKGVVAKRGKDRVLLAILEPAKAGLSSAMPETGTTQEEAAAIIAFIEGGAAKPSASAAQADEPAATPDQVRLGGSLFFGQQGFSQGGPACVACHAIGGDAVAMGGTFSTDLTQAHTRHGGKPLRALLSAAPFPAMKAAYAGRELSAEEATALSAYLQQAAQAAAVKSSAQGWTLFAAASAGLILLALVFLLIGQRRKKRSVNQSIYDRQIATR